MSVNITRSSRRRFLKQIAITSTCMVASSTILFGQKSVKMLRCTILGENPLLAEAIEKSDTMTTIDDYRLADVIYVSKVYQKNQGNIQEVLASGKHLIIEDHENNNFWIETCRKSGSLLAIVWRSAESSKLFENTNYYECELLKNYDFQKVMVFILFLEQHTKPLKFRIKEQNTYRLPHA